MSGLVTYDSSGDEVEPSTNLTVQSPTSKTADPDSNHHVNGLGTDLNSGRNVTSPTQGPLLGPARPPEFNDSSDEREDDYTANADHLSESDLLRLLTQPPHPMSTLPPEPEGQADEQVTLKFEKFLELKKRGMLFNEDLAQKSSYKNPNLFATLLERIGVPPATQYATTLPSNVFSLDLFPPWAYKEELSKSQHAFDKQIEASKRDQIAAGKRAIQFTKATFDSSNDEKRVLISTTKRTSTRDAAV